MVLDYEKFLSTWQFFLPSSFLKKYICPTEKLERFSVYWFFKLSHFRRKGSIWDLEDVFSASRIWDGLDERAQESERCRFGSSRSPSTQTLRESEMEKLLTQQGEMLLQVKVFIIKKPSIFQMQELKESVKEIRTRGKKLKNLLKNEKLMKKL